MKRLNEKKPGTAPHNPSMGDINDITASTQGKTRSDTEEFRKFYGTYHKIVMHNSGSRIRWRNNLKGRNEVKSGTNEEQNR